MKIKQFLLIIMFAALLPLFGAKNTPKEDSFGELTKAEVIARFTKLDNEITEDLKEPDGATCIYLSTANAINEWMKYYRFIEVDTEIDRSWYERAAKMLTYMGECKSYLTRFVRKTEKDKSPQYQKVFANLKEAHKRFAELVKKPTPVERDKLEKLRGEKYKYQAQKRRENARKTGTAVPDDE